MPTLAPAGRRKIVGTTLLMLGTVLIGFAFQFTALSQVSAARAQQLAEERLRFELADATAPIGQVGADGRLLPLGTPVAVLEIERIGVRTVVLEGTSARVTVDGPGHRRDTPLPGQPGASVVYGRQSSHGGPFGGLAALRPGDIITVTTGQGVSSYAVRGLRRAGDPLPGALASGAGRLTLVTVEGLPFLPDSLLRVDAELTSAPKPSPGRVLGYPALDPSELAMAGDPVALPMLAFVLLLLLLVTPLLLLSRRFWGPWQTWIVALPVLIALGSLAAQQLAVLLPNLL